MKWTHEVPTKLGLYHIRHEAITHTILELVEDEETGELSWEDPNGDYGYFLIELAGALYAGPIPMPKE